MKAPASISVVSSLILAIFASTGTMLSATNEPPSSVPVQMSSVVGSTGAVAVADSNLSRSSAEVLLLTQAGVDEEVVISFVNASSLFRLTADHVVYLSDLGVSNRIIQTMLGHDADVLARAHSTNITPIATLAREQAAVVMPFITPIQPNTALNTNSDLAAQSLTPFVISPVAIRSEANPSRSLPPSAKRKVVFPVREPYPVELTAPIVLLDTPSF